MDKPKSETPYVRREREEKPEKPKLLTPIQAVLRSAIIIPEKIKAKSNIVLPSRNDLQNMMVGISPKNKGMISGKIDDFNQKGIGIFKAIPPAMYQGKPVHELVSGKFRVLVIEAPNGNGDKTNGIRKFEIFKISPRGKTYTRKFREEMGR